MTEPEAHRIRWWLWPNLLALDAPVVAVVWQRFLGDLFGVSVPIAATVVLGLVVWGIYLTDRQFNAQRDLAIQPRHRFAATHSKLVASLAALSFLVAGSLTVALPWSYLLAGGIIAVLVAGYLVLVHLVKAPLDGGKEFLVGLLFAAGVAIPLIASDVEPQLWLASVGGFGLACWLNCRLIEKWEAASPESAGWDLVLGIAIIGCSTICPWPVGNALGASAGLFLLLHIGHQRIGLQLARVLVDVALLTPIFMWFLSSEMWMG